MIEPEEIERRIVGALPGAKVQASDLTGGGDHYRVIVVASQFENKGPVDRHRLVYASVSDVLGGALHALSLETSTPSEWQAAQDKQKSGAGGSLPRLS